MTFLIVVLIKISCDILVVRVPYILGKKELLKDHFVLRETDGPTSSVSLSVRLSRGFILGTLPLFS